MIPEWFFQVMTAIGGAAGVYAAIRSDLAMLHERATQALATATRAHERIDHIKEGRQ
jgi:hypothetical protein